MNLSQFHKSSELISPEKAIADRPDKTYFNPQHHVSGNPIVAPMPAHLEQAVFGLGCFWGAERLFWELEGVFSTAVGYSGGHTANPSYEDVCSERTAHSEVVLVFFDPSIISYEQLLKVFWEAHDPTQGMRQGNDSGTQYRSAIYCQGESQLNQAKASALAYGSLLGQGGRGDISTEIKSLDEFYYAEDYHQQYLSKNPNGYCNLAGTGVCYKAV